MIINDDRLGDWMILGQQYRMPRIVVQVCVLKPSTHVIETARWKLTKIKIIWLIFYQIQCVMEEISSPDCKIYIVAIYVSASIHNKHCCLGSSTTKIVNFDWWYVVKKCQKTSNLKLTNFFFSSRTHPVSSKMPLTTPFPTIHVILNFHPIATEDFNDFVSGRRMPHSFSILRKEKISNTFTLIL